MDTSSYLYCIRVEGLPLPQTKTLWCTGNQTKTMSKMTLNTINETTFEFSFNKEKTFNYGGKYDVTLEVEIFDVLINGRESIYYVQFDTTMNSYSLWSGEPDRSGGITHRELIPFGINGKSGFPINVVCDIVKEIDTNWVR
jgi:hypothetical protein